MAISHPMLVLAALVPLCVALPASAAPPQTEIFVSPNGSGTSDGSSTDRPTSIAGAETMIAKDSAITRVTFLRGTYRLKKAIRAVSTGRPVEWRGSPGAVLDGGRTATAALYVRGDNITVRGLKIQNFASDGIQIEGGRDIRIVNNHIQDIRSTRWSQAAIHGIQVAHNVRVEGNRVERTGYAGILFDASAAGNISNVAITDNLVIDTCQTVADCGAIYSIGRTKKSQGLIVIGNTVRNFGPAGNETKAIYLDDGLSGAVVEENDVSGSGTYAIHIHGGTDNVVRNNHFDIRANRHLAFIQTTDKWGAKIMSGNRLDSNSVKAHPTQNGREVRYDGKGALRLINLRDDNRFERD